MKSLKTKLVSVLAATAMLVAGLTPVAAQASYSPYNVNVLATYGERAMELVAGNNRVFYKVGGKLYTSDGGTPVLLTDFGALGQVSIGQNNPQSPNGSFASTDNYYSHSVLVGNKLYFWGYNNPLGWRLYVTDGTVSGTQLFYVPDYSVGSPNDHVLPNLYAGQGNIYFWTNWKMDAHGFNTGNYASLVGVKISDGTKFNISGNSFMAECYSDELVTNSGSLQQTFGTVGGKLVFEYSQVEESRCVDKIAAFDPAAAVGSQVTRLADPSTHNGTYLSMAGPQQFTLFNNKLYFYAFNGTTNLNQAELWATDGTDTGTTVVAPYSSTFHGLGFRNGTAMRPTVAGSYLYFLGADPSALNEAFVIYRTNGTTVEKWINKTVLVNGGSRTNAPAAVIGSGTSLKLIIDGQANVPASDNPQPNNNEMNVVDLTAKTSAKLVETGDSYWSGLACGMNCQSSNYNAMAESTVWDGKAWFTAVTNVDEGMAKNREIFYTDGTTAGTTKLTDNSSVYTNSDGNYTIGYQGLYSDDTQGYAQIWYNAWATKPMVVANDRLFYLSANGAGPTAWTLNSITRNVPPLVCGQVMTKLKIEADSASDLEPKFVKTTCEYTISVDYKTTKMDFTPTFTPSTATVLVDTVSKTTTLKSEKTQSVTLGAAGTHTTVDFVFGTNVYRVVIAKKAAPTAGGRAPTFIPPAITAGSVVSVAKNVKTEVKNGKETKVEVTVIGIGGNGNEKVKKVDENGKEDDEFKNKVPSISGEVKKVKVDDEHRVLVAGDITNGQDKDVIRLKEDGEKDDSFKSRGNTGGSNSDVKDIEVQKDGKIVVAGDLDNNGKNVTRLKDDGSKDSDFESHVPNFNGPVNTVKVQDDGKILVGGNFTNVGTDGNKDDRDNIVRLNKDGSLDTTFIPAQHGSHFNDEVKDIETLANGDIVVVGKSEKTGSGEADHVEKLHEDGHVDTTFNSNRPDLGSNETINAVAVKDNGEVFIGGDFHDVGDADGDNIAKLEKNGTPDNNWNPPAQGGPVNDIEIGKKGDITLAGDGDQNDGEHDDRMDKLQDNDPNDPRYDHIDNDRSANAVPSGTAGQTHIHGDGFKDGTTVTIGGQIAKVVKIDERDEDITIQVPKPDNNHKGDGTHEPKPADIVITVPGEDPITIPDGFSYTDIKEPQSILPKSDHINSDKDDEDNKGKVQDEQTLAAYIESDDPVVSVSKTPAICTVDANNQVTYLQRGDCKIVTDAPGNMGYADPAPVTEIIPVAGLDPELMAPTLPDWSDPNVPEVPDTGFQIPAPTVDDPSVPIDYTSLTPEVCEVSPEGVVTALDPNAICTVQLTTPGTPIYEPTAPSAPPVTITIPVIAWLPPAPATGPGLPAGTVQDPDVPAVAMPAAGGTVKLSTDLGFKYDKAKGTLTPSSFGIYFGPIKATINYTWTNTNPSTLAVTSGTGTCTVNWGVLKKWSKLSKADQKKYKKPLGAKVFSTTANCKVNAAAKAALAKPGTSFTATSDVLRTRMWPATYKPEKPIIPNVRPNPVPIEPRLRHYTLTISTQ